MSSWGRAAAVAGTLLACAVACAAPAQGAPGDLDPGFAKGGTIAFGSPLGLYASQSAVQADGSIVIGEENSSPEGLRVLIRRLDPSGELDDSFGSGGAIEIAAPGRDLRVVGLVIDHEQRILALVYRSGEVGDAQWELRRYSPDGAPDPTFGVAGTADFGSLGVSAYGLDVDSKDRILLGSSRLREDGSVDDEFGPGGSPGWSHVGGVSARADDSVLVTGLTFNVSHGVTFWGVSPLVLGEDGYPLEGFNFGPPVYGTTVATLPGSGGSIYLGVGSDLRRLNPDGSVDPSFAVEPSDLPPVEGLAIDDRERLLVLGADAPGGGYAPTTSVSRLLSDGSVDPSFGADGRTFAYAPEGHPVGGASLVSAPGDTLVGRGDGDLWRISTAAGRHDHDADGFIDPRDRCPWLPAPTARGCPEIATSFSALSAKAVVGPREILYGRLSATQPACSAGVAVEVFRIVRGDRRVFADVETTAAGRWRVTRRGLPPGTYFARALGHDEGAHGRCRGAVSSRARFG